LDILRDADIFALVSEHEGFGLVYLEAASQALPIVASTVGGQLDFLEHGRTGWLVPPGDVPRLAHALGALATQPALRQWMGRQSLAVSRRYHIDRVADTYLALFEDVQRNGG
jgi:glycosyltransferase involved in cell wall biosynthesis